MQKLHDRLQRGSSPGRTRARAISATHGRVDGPAPTVDHSNTAFCQLFERRVRYAPCVRAGGEHPGRMDLRSCENHTSSPAISGLDQ